MKICILGNSVGFRIRPARNDGREMSYSEILEARGHRVRNVSKSAIMINEAFAYLEEDVLTFFPDVVILHYGIVEASNRRTFRWTNNKAIVNYYTNRLFARSFTFDSLPNRVCHLFLRAFNAGTRRLSTRLGIQWQWLPTPRFLVVLKAMLEQIVKETHAVILVIGVTPCINRDDNLTQGSLENILHLNERMKAVCEQYPSRVRYLDPGSFLRECDMDALVPDAVHFSAEGHRQLAGAVLHLLEELPAPGKRGE